MDEVKINTDFIKLDQLLKWSGAAGDGAEARDMILSGLVKVNGEVVLQRGKKIYRSDKITINSQGEFIVV